MTEYLLPGLIGVLGTFVGGGMGWLTYKAQNRNTDADSAVKKAEAAEKLAATAIALSEPLAARVKELEAERSDWRMELAKVREELLRTQNLLELVFKGVQLLIMQIEDKGMTPVWTPDSLGPLVNDEASEAQRSS